MEVFPIPKIGKVFIPNEHHRQSGDDLKTLFGFGSYGTFREISGMFISFVSSENPQF
ncbi:hypothetical protein K3740_17830 [Ruegeria conchae]|uniref:hypothetical protein n=1 Tax=Ruegeria conchae TaxID=981384 RepID=UPI0021A82F28|nr:hypothetical protein [Ruegeria conchae]UWR02877.1 hypothetical protein K3740_17830 [Ruegeria conchae]